MPEDVSTPVLAARPQRGAPRLLLACALAIVAGQAAPLGVMLRRLPHHSASRTPSSDALIGALPVSDAGARIDAIAASLPSTHGVVVAHDTTDHVLAAYYVVAMRLWPRPVSLVTCRGDVRQHFGPAAPAAPPAWRLDLFPGDSAPLRAAPARTMDVASLCATPVAP
jgi:hypothetical protein